MQESESIGINVAVIYCYFVNKPGIKLISGFLISPGNDYQQLHYNSNTCSEKRYACEWLCRIVFGSEVFPLAPALSLTIYDAAIKKLSY